jgi:Pentapeptide repeats (8 copies)
MQNSSVSVNSRPQTVKRSCLPFPLPRTQALGQWGQWVRQSLALLLCWLCMGWGVAAMGAEASTLELIKPMSYSNAELKGKNFAHQDLRASDFANANMDSANFSGADLRGTIFSASVMHNTNLEGANLQFAMIDQVDFTEANLENAILSEAILLRSTFDNVKIAGADFTDAILDGEQKQILCQTAAGTNSQTGETTRDSLGCKS